MRFAGLDDVIDCEGEAAAAKLLAALENIGCRVD